LTKEDLITEAFGYLNSFKRHRALTEIKQVDKQYNELQMYKMIDRLELSLRAIKKEYVPSKSESND
jgi:uncharacterized protein YfeS